MIEHFYESVYGWFNSYDKSTYDRAVEMFNDDDIFVEIGSYKGRSASAMAVNIANSGKKIKFYCVDTWKEIEHVGDPDFIDGSLFNTFIRNTKQVKDYIIPIVKESVEAAKDFEDNSLSFVFIDASHDYDNVKNDINAWYPKMKSGGTLAGHDWSHGPVMNAVKEFAEANNFNIQSGGCWEIIITK